MNIVIAHLKKDLVPLRAVATAMVIVLIAVLAIRAMTAAGLPIRIQGNLGAAIEELILAFMIVRVIHQDSLTDITEFWRTRPISRPQLLLAKTCFLFPAIVAVLIVRQPWSGYTSMEGLASLLGGCAFLAGLAAFASVTSRFSEMIMLGVKILVVSIVWLLLLGLLASIVRPLHDAGVALSSGIAAAAAGLSVLSNLLVFAGFLAVVIYQYLTLKTEISIRALFCLCLASILASSILENLPR